ncbi:hypothetical protein TRFO_19560 [Tritrichomonas foetus]|uniref:Uncharacterized protein n=1 Tax=Tritrichomonas foetus TaxID=1144522 RepID=A0A1J4KHV6_9EUKA|nr:hypothetical protein TRFO_19560 [Tritrichomonas foetus]|eukprot:OHT10975.1 hypothetical protein TRFO_19560 [Tritrichomonas foetus]
MLFAAGGDRTQYEETIDAIIGALELYIAQLTTTAIKCADTPNKIKPDDIIRAMENDQQKQTRVRAQFEKYQKDKKALQESNASLNPYG